MKKRFLAVFLALALCLGLAPPAFAADGDFVIENGVLVEYNGPGGDVVIPDGVTSIGRHAFSDCTGLTSVTIPDGVTSIGAGAFNGCTGLTSVTIPNSVISIEGNESYNWSGAFQDCTGLTSVTIPNSVTSLGYGAFRGCTSLTSVTIQEGVTTIGGKAFMNCTGLTSVTIPNSVTSIGRGAFEDCKSLTSVTIPNSVTSIRSSAFRGCTGLTSVTIPNSVTTIGGSAFAGCWNLTSVTIPDSVTNIEGEAFSFCKSLTSVTIPNSVTTIGWEAFRGCTSLTNVTIPNSVTGIGWCAFSGTPWLGSQGEFPVVNGILLEYQGNGGSVTIPNGVTSIGYAAFVFSPRESLTSVTIPASVKVIKTHAFDIYIEPDIYWEESEEFFARYNLTDIYYGGTKEQWDAISIDDENLTLKTATIHYNAAGSPVGGFRDVTSGDYYADPVKWAVEKNITTGKTATTFAPNETCTHAQILTFLWRAAGEPASNVTLPFETTGEEYYLGAAKWAYEKGMIDKNFNHKTPCTRADAASYDGRFTDVPTDSPYATAVAWAAEKGITTGTTATTFSPNQICNRGQIVTFLHRAYA